MVNTFRAFYSMFIATDEDIQAWGRGMEFKKVFW